MALELAKPKAEEGPADLEPARPWRSALGLCGTHQHCTEDYNFPEVCSSIPVRRQGRSFVVQEHWRWHLYPGLGWWPVGGVTVNLVKSFSHKKPLKSKNRKHRVF